jgi:hypothetical protein
MILVAYMQKKDGLLKRAGSDNFNDQGFIPLLQGGDLGEEDPYYEAAAVDPVLKKVKFKPAVEEEQCFISKAAAVEASHHASSSSH